MKRLFRTSKTAVDPLPPPPPTALSNSSTSQPPSKKSLATMMGVGNGNGGGGVGEDQQQQHHHHHKSRHGGTHVTPFPLDVGRDTNTPTPPPPLPSKGPPSLLEIQQMNEERERDRRRDEWLAAQRSGRPPPPPPPPPARPSNTPGQGAGQISTSAPIPSPDGWSVISGPTIREGQGQGQGHYSAPIPIGTTPTPPSNSSTPTIQQVSLYLPPGARPPSPQQHRPATPTRAAYPPSLGHSQTSAMSVGSPYAPVDVDHYAPPSRAGRERGYSGASASARSSDHESGHSHSLSHSHGHGPPTPQKLNKIQPSLYAARSPLVNSYDAPGATQFPVPHPQMPHPLPHPQAFTPLADDVQAMRIAEPPDTREKEKEKKKFWGMNVNMNWADRRDRDRDRRDKNRDISDARPSFDEQDAWRDESSLGHGFVGSTGHGEEDARPKILGLDFGRSKDAQTQPAQVEKVNVAIQLLCAQPDPPFASAYEVCDRINHSSSAESVAKEAAAALRKQFKHGNEAERRNAAKVWLITMRNIEAKGYRGHATSKKFMAALEPILLAPPAKPLVSGNTHRIMTDILADLTYNFGAEKGCEGLGELWRKVKMPQESDLGKPLPADHPLYTPDSFYTAHITPPNSVPSSRRPSSPPSLSHLGPNDRSVPPPLPLRGPSPTFGGYAQLPNHGEDMRRLTDECIAAKESARVLMESLVYTRPEELELKPIIREFYEKCFHAHESLTNQMDWAQAEASQSRERVIMVPGSDEHLEPTIEERALSSLFEAHSQLAEALKQHDDMERMAMDEREMREVRERSKKDIRMDRSQNALLRPENGASSSRSPSPAPPARLPAPDKLVSSPRQVDAHLPMPMHSNNPFRGTAATLDRSRTPSPDRGPLPHPPKIIAASPARPGSPLGRTRAPGHRPLPNPFSRGNNGSQQSLREGANTTTTTTTNTNTNPSRSGTGSTQESSSAPKTADEDDDGDDDIPVRPTKPSRKALGKRRAVIDEDNHFDPDDMFLEVKKEKDTSASSEESYTADDFYLVPQKSIKYAYDAYQEKLNRELEAAGRVGGSGGHAGGSRMIHA